MTTGASIPDDPTRNAEAHAAAMDRFYAVQRHLYDATRPLFLFGRDRVVRRLDPPPGGTVLEIGCGTARNLVRAARCWPDCRLLGVDISHLMLETAERAVARGGLSGRIGLAQADAGSLDVDALFGISSVDRIFFSYALSMMPSWREALGRAAAALAPGGSLQVVDFGQYDRLPTYAKRLHFAIVRAHGVFPRAELISVMQRLAADIGAELEVELLVRGYAWSLTLRRGG